MNLGKFWIHRFQRSSSMNLKIILLNFFILWVFAHRLWILIFLFPLITLADLIILKILFYIDIKKSILKTFNLLAITKDIFIK
jgi:hypothetical protein